MAFFFVLATLVLFLASEVSADDDDYYQILSVSRQATEKQIKKSYLKLSKKWHPDHNPNNEEAHQMFLKISDAYQVLSDKEKRRIYDQHGKEGLKQGAGQRGGGMDPFDLFSQFGFGGFGGGRHQQEEEQRGPDITIDLQATLEDLYNGRVVEVGVRNQVLCPKCRGSGAKNEGDVTKCHACNGRGVRITVQQIGPGFVQQMQSTCDVCGGKGKIVKSKCPFCHGKKVVTGEKTLDVAIEAGMADGSIIEFENAADEHPDHAAGHILFKIVTVPHARFERKGHDLHYVEHISLLEALVGFSRSIAHLDGHQVTISESAVTRPGYVKRIHGEGMPHHHEASRKGDLFVKFVVDFPKQLTAQQQAGFASILK